MSNTSTRSTDIDISIIITAHAEGILIHHTIRSVQDAISALGIKYTHEIILHTDNPTLPTREYVSKHTNTTLKNVLILENSFGDLGLSRNFAIQHAKGAFVATIDADDLMSKNWLRDALDTLKKRTNETVAHSEVTIEFEGADSLIIKHGEIDHETDTLLSVYANRYNSVIVAPRSLLLKEQYAANSAGYGYEDWQLNCRFIERGIHNILIPHTAIFVRRKKANSEWMRQIRSVAVLRANPLLSFTHIRALSRNPFMKNASPSLGNEAELTNPKTSMKEIIKRYPFSHKIARKLKRAIARVRVPHTTLSTTRIPEWLQEESIRLHSIEKQVFPSRQLIHTIPVYDTITREHKLAGGLYKEIVDRLKYDRYDYLIFAPWLIKGGADRYTINYANTIASLEPDKRVLVVATLPIQSPWKDQLKDHVDFLDFGLLTAAAPDEIKHRLMEHIVENGHISHLHVINSEFGYEFVRLHEQYIKATNRKVIITSFSQSVDNEGRVYGYSHTHVPFVYDIASIITSDNQTVLDMWEREYGFDKAKLILHKQSIHLPERKKITGKALHTPLRVLWAARISFEKQPDIIREIGTLVEGIATIDIYGTIEQGFMHTVQNLPANVSYRRAFNGFTSLPLVEYDILLYTSLFDGMPNTLLDAAKESLPIIASAVGGIPEFIENNQTGLLINNVTDPKKYADAIAYIASHPQLATKLSNNAYQKLRKEFSPQQYDENIKAFLKRVEY